MLIAFISNKQNLISSIRLQFVSSFFGNTNESISRLKLRSFEREIMRLQPGSRQTVLKDSERGI
jgi:hypothetical protein